MTLADGQESEHGASIALLVNPRNDTVTAVRPAAEAQVLRDADRIDLSPILPDLELTVAELFSSLDLD